MEPKFIIKVLLKISPGTEPKFSQQKIKVKYTSPKKYMLESDTRKNLSKNKIGQIFTQKSTGLLSYSKHIFILNNTDKYKAKRSLTTDALLHFSQTYTKLNSCLSQIDNLLSKL